MHKLAPTHAKIIAFISQQQKWHHKMPLSEMVEVGGVEPPSETASTKLLRVYPAFNLARSMPTGGLIPKHPFGYTNFGARAESSEASPA